MEEDRICGANAVAAVFAKRPEAVKRLFYTEDMKEKVGPFCAALAAKRRPYRLLDEADIAKTAGSIHHGGVVAIAETRYVGIIDFVRPPRMQLLVILDGVSNPHNLGAIARSAAFFGAGGLLFHEIPGQAMPSDAAYRTAEGGLEYLELHKTRNIRKALLALEPHYRTVATAFTPDAMPLQTLPRDRPIALVLGNEERGVSWDTLETCRRRVRILGPGKVQSLNVAQAAAVLLANLTDPMAQPG
ncbi:RNA methyltransferase [Acidisphaera sp. L21]|uniref:TrmH family RNA methyltransferase n=1 Tax=Acidisphaera sp. L21 TaxID=1641851 RepID=UPI00131E73E3|nr:RNA methyltransferase [Acidisphaera sp. L21]